MSFLKKLKFQDPTDEIKKSFIPKDTPAKPLKSDKFLKLKKLIKK